jgi:cysteine synthase A
MIRRAYRTTSEAYEIPKIIQLGDNLFAASFFLMKLMPARFIIESAEREGLIREGSVVIETTSGTFGLGLAILCAERGLRLIIVSDPAIDAPLKRRLEDLGTRVEIVEQPALVGGFQQARLDRMAKLMAEHPGHFWPSQYDNPHNPDAYPPLVEMIVEVVGETDCLVGPVGSGGSMCGASKYMRMIFPKLHAVGGDTFGSVLFGQPDQKRLLRGLGNSLMPGNLNHTSFDEVHWVSARAAFRATRELHQTRAIFAGATSGAAYMVARWWAHEHPEKVTVCLFPDEGYRYLDTIYNDDWLKANDVWSKDLPAAPELVDDPREARPEWAYMRWGRRTYEQVMKASFKGVANHD